MTVTLIRPKIIDPSTGAVLGSGGYTSLDKSATVKRVKPIDLFAGATNRQVVWNDVINSSYVRYPSGTYRGTVYPPVYGFLSAGFGNLDSSAANARRVAVGRLLDAVKSQNVNLAQAMIEYRDTVSLFCSLAKELTEGYKALRHLHFKKAIKFVKSDKTFSKKWIEFQFGILPVVSDLEGLLDSLHDRIVDGQFIYVTARGGDFVERTKTYQDQSGYYAIKEDEWEESRVKLQARYKIQDQTLQRAVQFGFVNAPALGWELVPFSFVVDWMFGVGDYLNRLDALVGTTDFSYIQSTLTVRKSFTTGTGGSSSNHRILKLRSANSTSLTIPRPRYEASGSLRRLLTAVSLLHLIGK